LQRPLGAQVEIEVSVAAELIQPVNPVRQSRSGSSDRNSSVPWPPKPGRTARNDDF
jgi:hypothetical protein